MTWYAIDFQSNEVIATGKTLTICSDAAITVMPWGTSLQGEVAPYFLTTTPPEYWGKGNLE